jgi:hypothetical protein
MYGSAHEMMLIIVCIGFSNSYIGLYKDCPQSEFFALSSSVDRTMSSGSYLGNGQNIDSISSIMPISEAKGASKLEISTLIEMLICKDSALPTL